MVILLLYYKKPKIIKSCKEYLNMQTYGLKFSAKGFVFLFRNSEHKILTFSSSKAKPNGYSKRKDYMPRWLAKSIRYYAGNGYITDGL